MLFALLVAPAVHAQQTVGPDARYRRVAEALEPWITARLRSLGVSGGAIALVDDQTVVWARGFGTLDPARRTPVRADTPFRVASVSKLFTDVAVMQLAERGALDLDAPVERYLPEVRPGNPFGPPYTLRQLLSHRAGLVREPPVGHYFDPSSPTLAATATSLAATSLVFAPGTREKYSNAGVALAGYVIERTLGVRFADHVARAVLAPLGVRGSFAPDAALLARRARGVMWNVQGDRWPAPTFPLGLGPASELTASMLDLSRFLSMLFAGGEAPGGRLLQRSTLESMWDAERGAGLGFFVSRLDGRRRIGHTGWHYGFGTALAALPEERLGVAVSLTMDAATDAADRIADEALRLMLAARAGAPLPRLRPLVPPAAAVAARLVGRWEGRRSAWEFWLREGVLWGWSLTSGFPAELWAAGDTLFSDGLVRAGDRFVRAGDVLVLGRDTLRRVDVPLPDTIPSRWGPLIGEYGWDHDVLYIHERGGRLYALIEWFGLYPLVEVEPGVLYRFPDDGLYAGEEVRFAPAAGGRAPAVLVAGVRFARRALDGEDGRRFRIRPQRPAVELRRQALAATPPRQPDTLRAPELVDLAVLEPSLRFDIRYATADNFMGARMYPVARALLQRPAAEALVRAHRRLAAHGYGLLIHDAYRPWHITKMFWDATPPAQRAFVANPARGSKHNRGCAVDLTLYDLATGRAVEMVSGYDEFSPRADPHYPGGTSRQRWLRDLLRSAMEAEGFSVDPLEWWHYDHREWARYPVLNAPIDGDSTRRESEVGIENDSLSRLPISDSRL